MKKVITVLMIFTLLCVCGCGKSKCPQELIDAGNEAVQITEKYLDGSIDDSIVKDRLLEIEDYLEDLELSDDENDKVSAYLGTPKSLGEWVKSSIFGIRLSVDPSSSSNTYKELQELKSLLKKMK